LDALWTRGGRVYRASSANSHARSPRSAGLSDKEEMSVLSVSLEVRFNGGRYEARLADYPVLVETGRTPWEAVNRLVGAHRGLLERRWAER
jgi:hypothetical protein